MNKDEILDLAEIVIMVGKLVDLASKQEIQNPTPEDKARRNQAVMDALLSLQVAIDAAKEQED